MILIAKQPVIHGGTKTKMRLLTAFRTLTHKSHWYEEIYVDKKDILTYYRRRSRTDRV